MNKNTIVLISNIDELKKHEKAWKTLEKIKDNYIIGSSYNWVTNWWLFFENVNNNKIGYSKSLCVLVAYNHDELIGIMPLMKLHRIFFGVSFSFIEFIGQQWSGIYIDIISKDKNIKDVFIKYLKMNMVYDVLYLRYIPENTEMFSIKELFKFSACPEIDITKYKVQNEYIDDCYSKGLKQNLRTGSNRAIKNRDNLIETIEKIDDINFNTIIELSKSKLIDKKGWLYGDPNYASFYKVIFKVFESNVAFIKVNNIPVAYRANIFFNKMKICLDASFNRNYNKYELGIKSINLNIADSFEKEVEIHSMGPGFDEYKFRFSNKINYLYAYIERGTSYRSFIIKPIFKYFIKKKISIKKLK